MQVLDHLQVPDNVEPQGEALLSDWVRELLIPIYILTSQLRDSIKSCINASMYNKVLNQMSETLTEIKMNIKKILF